MNTIKQLQWIMLVVLVTTTSCKRNFEELNTNPNAPTEVNPSLLLRQVIYDYGEEMSYEGFVAGNLLAQHFTMVDFNLFDRHDLASPQLGGNPWPVIYTNLRDNEIMLDLARSTSTLAVYEGPALVMKAYMGAALTDIYGDAPFFEALQGASGVVTPAYDDQETIYTGTGGILNLLDLGIEALQNYSGSQALEGDLLFDGNLDSWITFARSLKIKYLMRVSGRRDVQVELQTLFNLGDFMRSNAQNATFDFTDGQPNSFRMQQLRDGDFNLFVLSETMEDQLKAWNDPRIEVLFRPTGNDTSGQVFEGLPNGPDASQTSITVADYSLTGTLFRENTGLLDANFLTAWETLFLLAEAAEQGIINASAANLYNEAVQLAFEYWQTPLPADYLSSGPAAFGAGGANPLEQILTQKWVANSINGYEGWIEYRRTGFPALNPVTASLNAGLFPVRLPYPADEEALNFNNFTAATGANGNSGNTRVWWDVD